MKRIEIGGVIPASAVSMGCMRLTDVKISVDSVIGTALDCGIDFFDHADIYGGGKCSTNTYKVFEAISEYTGASIIDGINSTINPLKNLEEGYISYATLDRDAVLIKCDDYDGELNLEADNLDLTNRSVIMRVGGSNEVEREEVYRRIEDAVNSLSNAIEYGIVPGAGKCYVQAYNELDPDNRMKFREVLSCIQDTLENNGLNTKDVGEDVIDSVTVVEQVIRNAFTMVAQVITTDKMIHDNIR